MKVNVSLKLHFLHHSERFPDTFSDQHGNVFIRKWLRCKFILWESMLLVYLSEYCWSICRDTAPYLSKRCNKKRKLFSFSQPNQKNFLKHVGVNQFLQIRVREKFFNSRILEHYKIISRLRKLINYVFHVLNIVSAVESERKILAKILNIFLRRILRSCYFSCSSRSA